MNAGSHLVTTPFELSPATLSVLPSPYCLLLYRAPPTPSFFLEIQTRVDQASLKHIQRVELLIPLPLLLEF